MEESNLVKHAKNELELAWGKYDEMDAMSKLMYNQVIDIITLISKQGDTGTSMPVKIGLLKRLLRFDTITPLSFSEDEFREVGGGQKQNKRNSAFFMEKDGRISYIDGISYSSYYILPWDGEKGVIGGHSLWHSTALVVNDNGDIVGRIGTAYLKADRKHRKLQIPSYELEYPEGWWLRLVKESDIKDAKYYYDCVDTDTERVKNYIEKELNFKNGKYREEIQRRIKMVINYMNHGDEHFKS